MKYLILVESPGKISKLEGVLNSVKNSHQYIVAATVGHILGLNSEKTIGVDINNKYKPDYIHRSDKRDVIANIRRLAKTCDQVIIASDLDLEGEFIGYSICKVLNISAATTPRIIFNEITKTAVLNAIQNPVTLDFNVLDAQKCRRVTDRLIGFMITNAARTVNPKLTVGRVQTIMVKLVVDREKEMQSFSKTFSYHTQGIFSFNNQEISSRLNKTFPNKQLAHQFVSDCIGQTFLAQTISDRIASKNPPAPLISATLQSLVSRSVGISPKEVMDTAQKLYQDGLISYPRTDCPRLPDEKMDQCEKFIVAQFGQEYHKRQNYKTKSKSAQEAHACIYPTRIEISELPEDGEFPYSNRLRRVYRFIWLYAVGSQMSPSKTKITKCTIGCDTRKEKFIAENQALLFEGYLKIWGKTPIAAEINEDQDQDQDENKPRNSIILDLEEGSPLNTVEVQSKQKASSGPTPYTYSSLTDKMDKIGIGRPSTYGVIMEKILDQNSKGFLYKGNKPGEKVNCNILTLKPKASESVIDTDIKINQSAYRNRIFPTDLGRAIDDFVNEYFSNIFNYTFTSDLEKEMQLIEEGSREYYLVVDKLYKEFAPKLEQFPKWYGSDPTKSIRKEKRNIGKYEGDNIYAYLAKYGPVLQVGDAEKPKYVSLPKEYKVDEVTLSEVSHLLGFPYNLGKIDDREIILKKSQYGLYLSCGGKNYQVNDQMYSVPPENEREQIKHLDIELVVKSIRDKDNNKKEYLRIIQDIKIVNGKFGPYFIFNNVLVGIPKFHNVDLLTYDECLKLYHSKAKKSKRGKPKPKIIYKKK